MNTLQFFQVECPKCHGQLNSTAPLSGQTTCPYCSTAYQITANVTLQTEMPGQIVPFATLSSDFEQSAYAMLGNEDYAPDNISGIISFKNLKGVYLPVYLFEGQYECVWSCRIKQTSQNSEATETHQEMYRSQNGVSKGKYIMICMAYDGVESSPELSEYIRALDIRADDLQPLQHANFDHHLFLIRKLDVQKTWQQYGEDSVHNIARKNTLIHLQSNDIKDFKCNISSSASREGQFIYYPVWMLHYRYNGESHHIFMDGTGRNGVKGTTLIDHALKAKAEKPFTILKYIAVAAIVIPLLLLLIGLYIHSCVALALMGLVFLTYRYYAGWHKARVIRKARKKYAS